MKIDPTREFISAKEAAFLLGYKDANALYIAKYRRKSYIPQPYKYGRALKFKYADVLAAIKPIEIPDLTK